MLKMSTSCGISFMISCIFKPELITTFVSVFSIISRLFIFDNVDSTFLEFYRKIVLFFEEFTDKN